MDSLMKYINRIHRCSGQYRSMRLKKGDLRPHQHIYIFHVCKRPGISQEQLAKIICVNKSNVTRQLSQLEKDGYVKRTPDEYDRRIMQVYPTQKAQAIYPEITSVMAEWNGLLLKELTEEEKEFFKAILERITKKAVKAVESEDGIIPDIPHSHITNGEARE